jgi:hypothetical protein
MLGCGDGAGWRRSTCSSVSTKRSSSANMSDRETLSAVGAVLQTVGLRA